MATMTPEEVARRFSQRPGYRLVSYREVGLPLWAISVRCLTLAHRPLPPLEEFALRTIDAELATAPEIAGFLGLEDAIVTATLSELMTGDHVSAVARQEAQEPRFVLTTKGRRVLVDLLELVPEERVYPLHYDGLTRHFVRLANVPLYRASELRQEGIQEIPAFPNDPPELEEMSVAEVAAVLKSFASPTEIQRDILSILGIEGRRARMFQRAIALVYEPLTPGDPQVAFSVDGKLSEESGDAFARAEGIRKLGVVHSLRQKAESVVATLVPQAVLEKAAPEEEVKALRQASESFREVVGELERRVTAASEEPERDALQQQIIDASERLATSEAALAEISVRSLEVYEHPQILDDALNQAASRLLIVSPWLRVAVVNQSFLGKLENTLKRGVQVLIGYGTGNDNLSDSDVEAEVRLRSLASQYDNLTLGRLGDTHAKVLAVDEKFVVVTSFNWLSFRGDPQKPFRDERGMLVTLAENVEEIFTSFAPRIRAAAARDAAQS